MRRARRKSATTRCGRKEARELSRWERGGAASQREHGCSFGRLPACGAAGGGQATLGTCFHGAKTKFLTVGEMRDENHEIFEKRHSANLLGFVSEREKKTLRRNSLPVGILQELQLFRKPSAFAHQHHEVPWAIRIRHRPHPTLSMIPARTPRALKQLRRLWHCRPRACDATSGSPRADRSPA